MRDLIVGFLLGAVLAGGLPAMAGKKIYNGSTEGGSRIQQYDYFRSRQQFLDIAAMRRLQEREAAESRAANRYSPYLNVAPCAK
jgi:hypothetical protein